VYVKVACGSGAEGVLELVAGHDPEHKRLAGNSVGHLLGRRLKRALVGEGGGWRHNALERRAFDVSRVELDGHLIHHEADGEVYGEADGEAECSKSLTS
jgi:hypothetical protein